MENRIDKIPETFCSNAGLPAAFTSALSFNEQIEWLLNAYNNLLSMIPDNTDFKGVKYAKQALNNSEKEIARNNIGAGTSNLTNDDINNSVKNNSVLYTNAQNLTESEKLQARNNIGAGTSNEIKTVNYTLQNLTETQKEIARNNIDAGKNTSDNAILYVTQNLTDEQKEIARNNIGVKTGYSDIPVLYNKIQNYPENMKILARNNLESPKINYSFETTYTLKSANWAEWETVPTYKIQKFIVNPEEIYSNNKLYIFNITSATSDSVSFNKDNIYFVNAVINEENTIAIAIDSTKIPEKDIIISCKIVIAEYSTLPDEWKNKQIGTIKENTITIIKI